MIVVVVSYEFSHYFYFWLLKVSYLGKEFNNSNTLEPNKVQIFPVIYTQIMANNVITT